jgi:hypothetical protein
MKLVFNRDEVAAAIGKTTEEFNKNLVMLEKFGFPKPVLGLDDCWSIMAVIDWVNTSKETQIKVG